MLDPARQENVFLTYGSSPTIVCGSALTGMIEGMEVEDALTLTREEHGTALGGRAVSQTPRVRVGDRNIACGDCEAEQQAVRSVTSCWRSVEQVATLAAGRFMDYITNHACTVTSAVNSRYD